MLIRQWARMGPGPSGLTYAITARPEVEGRIVVKRIAEWGQNMQINLDCLRDQFGGRPATAE